MVFGFMGDGIPIVYYGQEQYFHGASDPVSPGLFLVVGRVNPTDTSDPK